MQAALHAAGLKLKRLPAPALTAMALAYVLAVGAIDWHLPKELSLTLLYLLAVALVGWRAGRWPSLLVALVSVGVSGMDAPGAGFDSPASYGIQLWNTLARCIVFCGVGWLSGEAARLTRHLERRVEEGTAQWKAEAERHEATSRSLAETLERREQDIARQRRTEEALRQSEARYRTLAEASPDAIFILDGELKVEYVNSTGARLWGRQPADLVALPQTALFPPEIAERHSSALRRVLAGETIPPRDERIAFPGGDRWLETRLVRVTDDQDRATAVLGVSRDITERKRTEYVLQAQRDVSESLSFTNDLQTALDRLLGIAVQLEGLDSGGVYLLDPRSGAVRLAAHRGLSAAFAERVSHFPTGTEPARLIKAGPIYGSCEALELQPDAIRDQEGLKGVALLPLCHEGQVLGSLNLASHVDPSLGGPQTRMVVEAIAAQAAGAIARIRIAEALAQSEARLRTIIAGVPIVLFALDSQGVFTFEDGQGLTALGVAPGARVGRSAFEVYGHSPAAHDLLSRALRGETHTALIEINSQVLDCCCTPIRNATGEIGGCIGVATNVTQAQRLERQILEISDREQARIGQDIHDGLCQQLVSLAFDANALERQLRAQGNPESETASRIASLLDQTITQSRQLARGLFPVRLEWDGLPSALEELARTTHERHGLDCVFANEHPTAIASRTMAVHLYRIAQEAVTNAARHAQAQRITVSLTDRPDHLELRIEDDGAGLMAGQATDSPGMGLHIMRYRARSLGGSLQIGPRSGGGTTVSCCVPKSRR